MEAFVEILLADVRLLSLSILSIVGVLTGLTDLFAFKVSNWVIIPLLISGVLFHSLLPAGYGLSFAVGGLVVGFLLLIPAYYLGGIGAADVKLLSAIGAWLGATGVCAIMILTVGFTVFYSLVMIVFFDDWKSYGRRLKQFRDSSIAAISTFKRPARDPSDQNAARGSGQQVPMAAMMTLSTWVLFLLRLRIH